MFEHFKQVRVELFKTEAKLQPVKPEDARDPARTVKMRFGLRVELDETFPEEIYDHVVKFFPGLRQRIDLSVDGRIYTDQAQDNFTPLVIRFYEHHMDMQPSNKARRPTIILKEAMVVDQIKCICQSGTCVLEFKLEEKITSDTWKELFWRWGTKMYIDVEKTQVEAFDVSFARAPQTTGPLN